MIQQPQPVRRCELCGNPYAGQSDATGICQECCSNLGGGKFSARIVQQEARAATSPCGYIHNKRRSWKR